MLTVYSTTLPAITADTFAVLVSANPGSRTRTKVEQPTAVPPTGQLLPCTGELTRFRIALSPGSGSFTVIEYVMVTGAALSTLPVQVAVEVPTLITPPPTATALLLYTASA